MRPESVPRIMCRVGGGSRGFGGLHPHGRHGTRHTVRGSDSGRSLTDYHKISH